MTGARLLRCSRGRMARAVRPWNPADPGFSLIEVTIALSVAGFCLLAILGLLQTGVTSQRATTDQTAATGIISMIFADLLSSAGTNPTPRFQINLTNSGASPQTVFFSDGGKPTGAVGSPATGDSRFRASLDVIPPAAGTRAATGVRILITWPAAADSSATQWPTKFAGSVETWTALDRN